MPTYVSLLQFTDQGIRNIKESPTRLDAARQAYKAAGAKLRDFYAVMGPYDCVVVAECTDDETASRLALAVGAKGNVRSQTMRAFTEDEYRKIIGALP